MNYKINFDILKNKILEKYLIFKNLNINLIESEKIDKKNIKKLEINFIFYKINNNINFPFMEILFIKKDDLLILPNLNIILNNEIDEIKEIEINKNIDKFIDNFLINILKLNFSNNLINNQIKEEKEEKETNIKKYIEKNGFLNNENILFYFINISNLLNENIVYNNNSLYYLGLIKDIIHIQKIFNLNIEKKSVNKIINLVDLGFLNLKNENNNIIQFPLSIYELFDKNKYKFHLYFGKFKEKINYYDFFYQYYYYNNFDLLFEKLKNNENLIINKYVLFLENNSIIFYDKENKIYNLKNLREKNGLLILNNNYLPNIIVNNFNYFCGISSFCL